MGALNDDDLMKELEEMGGADLENNLIWQRLVGKMSRCPR
jgi:hypothetical protein